MTEAIFGLIGVLIGSGITWFQSYYTNKQSEIKNAKYLAIRVVCILDKFIEDCAEVVNDDGLCMGQKNSEGCREAQVKHPSILLFPDDVDWRSIDYELMYKLLSFSSDIVSAGKIIDLQGKSVALQTLKNGLKSEHFTMLHLACTLLTWQINFLKNMK